MSLLSASEKESGMTMNYGSTKNTNNTSSRDMDITSTVDVQDVQDGDFRYIESTAAERRRKCANALLPILICTVLMGAIAFSLFRSFDSLYPGHGNGSSYGDIPSTINTGTNEDAKSGTTSNRDKNSLNDNKSAQENLNSSSMANCALHSKCEMLGLTGACCPTSSGVTLQCCN